LRVFVALEIPSDVRGAIGALIRKLEPECRGARWVRPESVHVTLKFIGEASPQKVDRIKATLSGVRAAGTVRLQFRGAGFFPNERHPRVFWAGIGATPNLAKLAGDVERGLERLEIPRETREFHPHLTLARFKSEEGLPKLRAALANAGPLVFGSMETTEMHLFESRLERGGAVYTRLATFEFAGAGA
jgi:RNA 2',3'-cyclic 3'-phosphodiesterase